MKLGDWVHCTRCIRKTGNHYEVIPAGNTTDSTETALYFEHGAEENAEELMNVANKRLCGKASEKTQQVAQLMCSEAARVCPEIAQYLVPNCVWHGGVCHEPESCGRCIRG